MIQYIFLKRFLFVFRLLKMKYVALWWEDIIVTETRHMKKKLIKRLQLA